MKKSNVNDAPRRCSHRGRLSKAKKSRAFDATVTSIDSPFGSGERRGEYLTGIFGGGAKERALK